VSGDHQAERGERLAPLAQDDRVAFGRLLALVVAGDRPPDTLGTNHSGAWHQNG
jgi:hypothetical protein